MGPKLRRLSADEVLAILGRHGFVTHSQRGSHVKLKRAPEGARDQILTIPRHRVLDPGTLHAIFRQACRFIPETELRRQFYTD